MAENVAGTSEVTEKGGVVIASGADGAEIKPALASATAGINAETGKPEGLPEGFESWEDLSKAYNEMVKGKETAATEAGTETPAAEETTKPTKLADVPAERVAEVKAGLAKAGGMYADARYETAALEFETLGDVTPETIKTTAEAFGVTEEIARQFVDSQKALREAQTKLQGNVQDAQVADLHSVAGGPEGYAQFVQWGQTGLTADQRTAYDAVLDTNPAAAKVMLQGFVEAWKSSGQGPQPRDVTRQGGGADTTAAGDKGYDSQAEMVKDMSDPRYGRDPAFRAQVARRIAAGR